jgi:hypothetical protein
MLRPVQKLLHRDRILFYGLTFNINPKLIHKSVLYDFVAFPSVSDGNKQIQRICEIFKALEPLPASAQDFLVGTNIYQHLYGH